MNSENTRAYLAFALVGLMFVLVIALFCGYAARKQQSDQYGIGFYCWGYDNCMWLLFW